MDTDKKDFSESEDWRLKTREELIQVIDRFLGISSEGGWAVRYKNPLIEKHEDGSMIFDSDRISGVDLYIQFNFIDSLSVKDNQ